MQAGILRKVKGGLARESVYGVKETLPNIFPLGMVEFMMEEVIDKTENKAMLGSTYEVDKVRETNRYAKLTLKLKLDENILPLILLQNFSISSSLVSGESAVWEHVLTYLHNNASGEGQSFTFFVDDPDLQDEYYTGLRFDKFDFPVVVKDEVYIELTGVSNYPVAQSVSIPISASPNSFVGKNTTFQLAKIAEELATQRALNLTLRHSYPLSGDDINFALGNGGLTQLFTQSPRFGIEFKDVLSDYELRTLWSDNEEVKARASLIDTTRYVEGSVANTNPSVVFDYPAGFLTGDGFKREGAANDIRQQNIKILPVDDPAVEKAPVEITVVNAIEDYDIAAAS
jgi:hypothetical protein